MKKTEWIRQIKERKNRILARKLKQDYRSRAGTFFHPSVETYARFLGVRLSQFVSEQIKIADNGFKTKTLAEQINHVLEIKPKIEEIVGIIDPKTQEPVSDHPHIGIARELAEQTFYQIMEAYTPILEKSYSLGLVN